MYIVQGSKDSQAGLCGFDRRAFAPRSFLLCVWMYCEDEDSFKGLGNFGMEHSIGVLVLGVCAWDGLYKTCAGTVPLHMKADKVAGSARTGPLVF